MPLVPPKGRSYRPKVKGCHECSKRRICCDRTEPTCQKCASRSLKCSGYGVRYRFNDGVAARGFWAGKTIDKVYEEREETGHSAEADSSQIYNPAKSQTGKDTKALRRKRSVKKRQKPSADSSRTAPELTEFDQSSSLDFSSSQIPSVNNASEDSALGEYLQDQECFAISAQESGGENLSPIGYFTALGAQDSPVPLLQPSVSIVPPWANVLLLHFSEHIASEMVAIDGNHNGYRHILLPLAQMDELVMNAVVTVSAFHMSQRQHNGQLILSSTFPGAAGLQLPGIQKTPQPSELYSRTLTHLRRRQDISLCDTVTRHSVLLALLLLIVTVIVTGSDDFPILFRLFESAIESMGGEEGLGHGELSAFILRQFHKLSVYAAPFLSEEAAITILSSQTLKTQGFSCLSYCYHQAIGQTTAIVDIMGLIQQSHEIYLHRAARDWSLSSPPAVSQSRDMSITRVQRFKETLQAFPRDLPGEKSLVWCTFVAAADCVLEEHKTFFRNALRRHHERSGFNNILRGLDYLEKVWAMSSCGDKWTAALPRLKVFVV